VLEINPQHPLVRWLNRDLDNPQLAQWAHLLYNQAILTLSARIEDPAAFVARLNSLLVTLIQAPEDVPAEPAESAPEPVNAAAEPAESAPEPAESALEPVNAAAEPEEEATSPSASASD